MRLRNLSITDAEVENRELVIDGVQEVERVIEDNYEETLNREIGIEFNIGSRLGFSKEYLVVYCNPDYKNNPYVFMLRRTEEGKELSKKASLDDFEVLGDLETRQDVLKSIAVGFKNLPKYAFLGLPDMVKARGMASDYDDLSLEK
jgi:hypothetical protein